MEKELNCVLKLSLKEMALRKVVINLYNQNAPYAIGDLEEFDTYTWRVLVEIQVKDQVSNLELPESLKAELMPLVRLIGSDILSWKDFHGFFDMHILKQLHWTCVGEIDYRKTAEKLIHLETLDPFRRYKLACLNCLVECIPLLWEDLDVSTQDVLLTIRNPSVILYKGQLKSIWPYILKGKTSVLEEKAKEIALLEPDLFFIQYCIAACARSGNKVGTEYFFRLLTAKEKDSFRATALGTSNTAIGGIIESLKTRGRSGDVLHYLLSLLSPEQQVEVLINHPLSILRGFLVWPWQDSFLAIADVVFSFLPKSEYIELIKIVLDSGIHFPNLFQKLFLNSEFRGEFLSSDFLMRFLEEFFINEDIESIQLVLRNVSQCQRLHLVLTFGFFKHLHAFINFGRWHFIELCFREIIQSTEEKESLKNWLVDVYRVKYPNRNIFREHEWRRFFELLDKIVGSVPNKRSLEDATVVTAKKLYIVE